MMLEIKGIETFYGTSHVLFGLSLRMQKGELVGLLGRNGAGKTTTLRSIIGVSPPKGGSIFFQGREITGKPPYYISQLGIGFIPDNRRIFPDLTVRDNLDISVRKQRDGTNEWTLTRIYELFPPLQTLEKRKGQHLSGGEQQMLAIGRALMGNPSLLLMDEPTQGLAPLLVRHLSDQVARLHTEGMAVLLSEQNVAFTSRLGNRVYIIDNGSIRFEGTSEDLESNTEIRQKYLLA